MISRSRAGGPAGLFSTSEALEGSLDRVARRGHFHHHEQQQTVQGIRALARANYEVRFDPDTRLSERVFSRTPGRESRHRGCPLRRVSRKMMAPRPTSPPTPPSTPDRAASDDHDPGFLNFRVSTLNGPEIRNKGMALFPRKSTDTTPCCRSGRREYLHHVLRHAAFWYDKLVLVRPTESWEFVQLGNCGSPIETDDAGSCSPMASGPMRRYVIGAILLDRDDPRAYSAGSANPCSRRSRASARAMSQVVYSCGSLVHAGILTIRMQ